MTNANDPRYAYDPDDTRDPSLFLDDPTLDWKRNLGFRYQGDWYWLVNSDGVPFNPDSPNLGQDGAFVKNSRTGERLPFNDKWDAVLQEQDDLQRHVVMALRQDLESIKLLRKVPLLPRHPL